MSGYWLSDYIRIGDEDQNNPPFIARMGCHRNEQKLFYTQKANGIMGIGLGPDRHGKRASVLQDFYRDPDHVAVSKVFSICLADWGGLLTVGGYNASLHTSPVKWIPLFFSGSYDILLDGISVNGRVVKTSNTRALVDTGTTYVFMASDTYRALRDGIESHCRTGDCGGAHRQGECWHLPGSDGLDLFPTISLHFDRNVTVRWEPRAYLYWASEKRSWCYAFQDDGPGAATTLGAAMMLHYDVVFNIRHQKLGLAPANCPEYHRQDLVAVDAGEVPWSTIIHTESSSVAVVDGAMLLGGIVITLLLLLARYLCLRHASRADVRDVLIPADIDGEVYNRADGDLELLACS